jgi:hypothetical protein
MRYRGENRPIKIKKACYSIFIIKPPRLYFCFTHPFVCQAFGRNEHHSIVLLDLKRVVAVIRAGHTETN